MDYRRFGNKIVARIDRGEEILEQVKKIAAAEHILLADICRSITRMNSEATLRSSP